MVLSIENISIQPIDGTLIGTTTSGLSGFGSNSYEGVLHTPQISRTGTPFSDEI